MLVLTRAIDESIVINGNIVVTIVDVRGDKVRIGVDAPLDVPVHRHEVHEAIASWQAVDAPGEGDGQSASASTATAAVDLPETQVDFVDRLVQDLAQRGQRNVTRSDVVQSIVAGVEHLADDLSRASSTAEIQQLVRSAIRGAEQA